MNKIKLLIFVLFLITVNLTYSYNYNSSYTNITLEQNGWCKDIEVQFTIYDQYEYDIRKDIEDNLCKDDEDPEEDRCELFTNLEGNYIVYTGPFDSMPILKQGDINSNKFSVLFNSPNQYLVEIYPELNTQYNDYHQIHQIVECKQADPTKVQQEIYNVEYYNQTFKYDESKLTIKLENTPIKTSSEIKIEDFSTLENKPENSIETIKISIPEDSFLKKDYTKLDLEFEVDLKNSREIKVYKFNSQTQGWDSVTFKNTSNTIILENTQLGLYSITKEKDEEMINNTLNEEIDNENLVNNQAENSSNEIETINLVDENELIENENKLKMIGFMFLSLLGLIFIILIILKISHKKQISTYNNKDDTNYIQNSLNNETLTTYEQTYKSTKEYIKQYKSNYSKEQLIDALEKVNVPKDIISKVIAEEY